MLLRLRRGLKRRKPETNRLTAHARHTRRSESVGTAVAGASTTYSDTHQYSIVRSRTSIACVCVPLFVLLIYLVHFSCVDFGLLDCCLAFNSVVWKRISTVTNGRPYNINHRNHRKVKKNTIFFVPHTRHKQIFGDFNIIIFLIFFFLWSFRFSVSDVKLCEGKSVKLCARIGKKLFFLKLFCSWKIIEFYWNNFFFGFWARNDIEEK